MQSSSESRLARASISLEGLSVGDAFGEKFFVHPDMAANFIDLRATPGGKWNFTDDTQMALSIVSILRQYQEINQDELAKSFASHYEMQRGYGSAMHGLLADIRNGDNWKELSTNLFGGQGSYGNGAAMRVAPLGAYFADDFDLLVSEARKSAEVTHAHPEAIAGAIAVAVAAGMAAKLYGSNSLPTRREFLDELLRYIPVTEVKSKIFRARDILDTTPGIVVAAMLGNGSKITAQDTVPFTLWSAAKHLKNYQEAIWETVRVLGDRDTTCAIVGGIVALSAGIESIPVRWLQSREPLPQWAFKPA
jgi:ADP-ribosylglycohydrolase